MKFSRKENNFGGSMYNFFISTILLLIIFNETTFNSHNQSIVKFFWFAFKIFIDFKKIIFES